MAINLKQTRIYKVHFKNKSLAGVLEIKHHEINGVKLEQIVFTVDPTAANQVAPSRLSNWKTNRIQSCNLRTEHFRNRNIL